MKENRLLILSILAILGLGSSEKVLAESKSFTSCRIKNSQALGFLHVSKGSVTIAGPVSFLIYDADGQLIDQKDLNYVYKYVYAYDSKRELVASVRVDRDARKCEFTSERE
jgi:hypothetical protein